MLCATMFSSAQIHQIWDTMNPQILMESSAVKSIRKNDTRYNAAKNKNKKVILVNRTMTLCQCVATVKYYFLNFCWLEPSHSIVSFWSVKFFFLVDTSSNYTYRAEVDVWKTRELRNQVIFGIGMPKPRHCNMTGDSMSRVTTEGGKLTIDGFTVINNDTTYNGVTATSCWIRINWQTRQSFTERHPCFIY